MALFPDTWSRRRVGLAVGAVGLLVLAVVAMAGLPLDGDGGDATAPPESMSNDTADPPPGINETGVVDDAALLAAHRQALVESGFAYRYDHNVTQFVPYGDTIPPRAMIRVTGEVRATADLATVEQRTDREFPTDEEIVSWTNGTAGVRRVVANGTTYESYTDTPIPRVTHHYLIPNLVSVGRWNLTEVRGTGSETRFLLRANSAKRVRTEREDKVTNFTARMVVDPEGRIHYFEASVTHNDTTTHPERGTIGRVRKRHFVYELTAVGNVSVPPPEWIDEAERLGTSPIGHHRPVD